MDPDPSYFSAPLCYPIYNITKKMLRIRNAGAWHRDLFLWLNKIVWTASSQPRYLTHLFSPLTGHVLQHVRLVVDHIHELHLLEEDPGHKRETQSEKSFL